MAHQSGDADGAEDGTYGEDKGKDCRHDPAEGNQHQDQGQHQRCHDHDAEVFFFYLFQLSVDGRSAGHGYLEAYGFCLGGMDRVEDGVYLV